MTNKPNRWRVIPDESNKRRWRYVDSNGVPSREAYLTRASAVAAAFEAFARARLR
jgi:hypothetical protein